MTRGVYIEKKCESGEPSHTFKPNPHQTFVVDEFLKSKYRGMLLYHKLGSGKTCTSILLADRMLKEGKISSVFVFTPGSLRENWIMEYCKTCGFSSDFLSKYFTFITYNYDVSHLVRRLNLNRSLVIIDEAHNLINGVKNMSKTAFTIYAKILDSNCRVLALSGTPVFSETCEWALLGNLLKPRAFPMLIRGGAVDKFAWDSCRITDKALEGIVSYFPGQKGYYPKVIYQEPIRCPMTDKQYTEFLDIDHWERNTRAFGPPPLSLKRRNPADYWKKHTQFIVASKWILTRRVSNFYYPMDEMIPIKELTPEEMVDNELSESMTDFLPDYMFPKGWFKPEYLDEARLATVYSPKFTALFLNFIMHKDTKHVVFTFFKTRSGITMLKTLLTHCGVTCEVFSGDMNDKERERVLRVFNSKKNRDGKLINVLLVTDAGMEGITLLEVNNVHILESHPKENSTRQAIGRAVRYKSHHLMPKDRQYVNVWRYWSTAPDDNPDAIECVDERLYNKSMKVIEELDEFSDRLKANSIENLYGKSQ